MHAVKELLPGTWLMTLPRFEDERGDFTKLPTTQGLSALGILFEARDQFITRSRRDVIRGLHFQLPPHDHAKLVSCLYGCVEDVIVDLRKGPGFGRVASVTLCADEPKMLYLPAGIAHGFCSRADDSTMLYLTSSEHAASHDAGVLWSSIDFDWGCATPVLSARDHAHPSLAEFHSPF